MNPPGDRSKTESSKNPGVQTLGKTGLAETGPERQRRKKAGNLIVITGPSGVGKGTLVTRVLDVVPDLTKSVSVTTRAIRPHETDGEDYFFRSHEEFQSMVDQEKFLEWAEYAGNYYGTPKNWVRQQLQKGKDVVLEIEVHGAKSVLEQFPEAVLIFLSPPSLDELKSRLKGRATEPPATVQLRLTKARQEIRSKGFFHYEVVNDNLEEAVINVSHIVYAERCRIRNHKGTGAAE